MKTFKTRKFLIAIILTLLLIDAVVLGFFIVKNKPDNTQRSHPQKTAIQDILKKEVDFTDEQLARFQEIRTREFESLKPLFGKVRKSKDNFYSLLYQENVADSTRQILADSIAISQKELDLQMFSYFHKIREICTDNQLPKFDSSMKKVILRMTGRRSKDHKSIERTKQH